MVESSPTRIKIVRQCQFCPSIPGGKLNLYLLLLKNLSVSSLPFGWLSTGQVASIDGEFCIRSRFAQGRINHIDMRSSRNRETVDVVIATLVKKIVKSHEEVPIGSSGKIQQTTLSIIIEL